MNIDPASFNAFVVHADGIEELYFSGSAAIAEQWFNNEHPNTPIISIVSDVKYDNSSWGQI
jgi:hypothetical protein